MKLRLYVEDDNEIGEPYLKAHVEATEYEEAYDEDIDEVLVMFADDIIDEYGEAACEKLAAQLRAAADRIDDLIISAQYHEALDKAD